MYTAPRSVPPVSSEYAPTAISDMPSPLRSPMFAIEVPNVSLFASVGPPFVPDAIFTGPNPPSATVLTVPSDCNVIMYMTTQMVQTAAPYTYYL